MVATTYTAPPLPYGVMGNGLHKTGQEHALSRPEDILARNLRHAFSKRKLSARSVADAIGVSNKTVSNMLNGTGASQLDKLSAVAAFIKIPLWQLLCPAIEISQKSNAAMHELVEQFVNLSEVGQASVRRVVKAESALAKTDSDTAPDAS